MTTNPGENRPARVLEYGPWILRDYALRQGPSTAIVVVLIGFLTVLPVMQGMAGVQASFGAVPLEIATRMLRAMMTPMVFIGTFFATNGIISEDRKHGYYRFLFAKPVSPSRYYAFTFALYGFGLMIVTVVLLGAWAAAVRPMFPVEMLAVVLIMYVAYGGIGFLLSAAWRFDWLSLATTLLIANIGWSVWGNADGWRHRVLYLLPPVHRATDVYAMVGRDASAATPWTAIAWLAGYGLACFALGLVVIRRRPLGST
jgi:ABC-type transport system involved in multi-copper enzyme maturation permease subunit